MELKLSRAETVRYKGELDQLSMLFSESQHSQTGYRFKLDEIVAKVEFACGGKDRASVEEVQAKLDEVNAEVDTARAQLVEAKQHDYSLRAVIGRLEKDLVRAEHAARMSAEQVEGRESALSNAIEALRLANAKIKRLQRKAVMDAKKWLVEQERLRGIDVDSEFEARAKQLDREKFDLEERLRDSGIGRRCGSQQC